jgi:hypothetical protein
MMFLTLRRSRYGRTLLAFAAALAICGSFGLHPEPACAAAPSARDSVPLWSVVAAADGESHACLACLAHRSVSLPRLTGVVLQPGVSVAAFSARLAPHPANSKTAPHEGRAPPPAHS